MSSTIGQYSVGELYLMVDELEHRLQNLRREQLPSLLSEVTEIAAVVSRELDSDREAMMTAEVEFDRDIGWFRRLLPFGKKSLEQERERWMRRYRREVEGDREIHERLFSLLQVVNGAAQPVEWRAHPGSIAAVFNPATGRVEWRSSNTRCVAGVYNPVNRGIEWRESAAAVFGVFHPASSEVVWRENAEGGICGVFNPIIGEIEWRLEEGAGVFGAFMADREAVIWKSVPASSVVAAWNRANMRWEWRDSREGGLACAYHDGTAYRTGFSWCPR